MNDTLTDTAPSLLQAHDIYSQRGFLPLHDPITQLPAAFAAWEDLARQLPKLLAAGRARQAIEQMPALDATQLNGFDELNRAMLLLSYFGHAYVFCDTPPSSTLPAVLAVPWQWVAQALGRPPVLSYASHALYNWRRLDPNGPIELGNIARLENFLGGVDEDWFVLVHVAIEAKAGPGLVAIIKAQEAVTAGDAVQLTQHLQVVADTLEKMLNTLKRMPEKCDPYIYYTRVRPFIFGWKDNPALPQGVFYEGVEAYNGQPQTFRGETGAQSSIIPAFDNALGINYDGDQLGTHLIELRDYMPPKHREFVGLMGHQASIRDFVIQHAATQPALAQVYNTCIELIGKFREKHLEYAHSFINVQSQRLNSNPVDVGTGGTPFMHYLRQHALDVKKYLIIDEAATPAA
jgi:indoleamine 2,3-dioxygenase